MHLMIVELLGLAVIVVVCYGAVALMKYLIRYGIDYYFIAKERSEQKRLGSEVDLTVLFWVALLV